MKTDAALPERLPVTAVERPWGGDGVPHLGLPAPNGRPIGEYWLPTDAFPLLVKIIDARERLSIQLHPDDATAHRLGLPSGKTECWYILDAAPNAELWLGLAPDVDPSAFLANAERGADISSSLLRYVPRRGEIYFVPAGTVHAIGGGLTVLEVQQPADVTFRVFDWNRQPARQLHLDQARSAIRRETAARRIEPLVARSGSHERLRTEFFAIRETILEPKQRVDVALDDREIWFVAEGRGSLVASLPHPWRGDVTPGTFLLMPTGKGSLHWEAVSDGTDALCRIVRMARR